MCLICIDMARGAMRPAEARRALGEMGAKLQPTHLAELEQRLAEAEAAETAEATATTPAPTA